MAQVTCELVELLEKIDPKSGKTIEKNPEFLKSGDIALVKIIPLKPICIEKYADYPPLGRFAIFDQDLIIATGTSIHVEKKDLSIMTSGKLEFDE
jgi:elongation factor 1-alpha